ncbi:hypothetical protein ABBQ38_014616 [Trebouxia sp. C0009 RCD-2024]
MGASFLCICPPKSIQFDQTRDNSKAEISARLSEVAAFHGREAQQIYTPGAGLVCSPAPDLSVTTQGSCFAAFKGRLDNYPYLVRKYCARRLDGSQLPTLNQIKDAAPLSAAEVICELYTTLGTSFLPKLKGDFAFVCFDSQKLRVLATRASAGGVSLWQARGPDACLCIGSGDCEPAGSHSKLDIQPGFFKYGWYAEPQRFAVAVSQSVTTAAASAALKAMEGITMAPKPPDLKRHSTNSVADVSSQSTDFAFRPASVVTSSVKTASAPIAIGSFRNSSNDDSLGSSMYTDTVLEGSGSVTSDTSMFTTKTNKTRRGKRGGKKQRESSMKFRMQSVSTPASPMQISSPCGSQADRRGWWRSSASDKAASPLMQAINAGMDLPDDASQGDTMSSMSLGDLPMPGVAQELPSIAHGSADDAWGHDTADTAADTADDLQFRLSSTFSGHRLPTVVEHMEEGMSRPQSLADLSKAGWTVDSALSRCSSRANISRLARISSFPELTSMPEMAPSSGSSPASAFPQYPSHRQLADLSAQMSAAFSGLSSVPISSSPISKPSSSLNPNAATFEPGQKSITAQASTGSGIAPAASQAPAEVPQPASAAAPALETASELAVGFALPDAGAQVEPAVHVVAEQNTDTEVISGDKSGPKTLVAGDAVGDRAGKAVARRLLLKKRVPSFNKSKSCNDLAAVEPKSPSRSPFAPLAHLAQ